MKTIETLSSSRKTLRVLIALRGHALNGLSNAELAAATGLTASTVCRCIDALEAEGLATRLDTGRYAPGIAFLQYAQATADELHRAQLRIHEVSQRIGAGARA